MKRFEHHIAGGGDVDTLERLGRLEHHRDGAGRTSETGTQGRAEPEQVGRLPRVLDHRLRPREQRVGLDLRPRDPCRSGRSEQEADSITSEPA